MINEIYYPYYGHLSPQGKALYEQLLSGAQKVARECRISGTYSFEEAAEIVSAIYMDRPELFWMDGGCSGKSRNGIVVSVEIKYNSLAATAVVRQKEFFATAEVFLAGLAGKTPLQKERIIHDRMVKSISYKHAEDDQTAYAAIVEKRAVCAGYTRAFQYLMQRIGLPCYYCSGIGKGKSDAEWRAHSWNIIKLADEYYNLDLTWDDCYDKQSDNQIDYTYYNCSDSVMARDHKRGKDSAFLPKCNGTRYTFEKIFGVSPELMLVYQDGVTDRNPIRDNSDFARRVVNAAKEKRKGKIILSFPTRNKQLCSSASRMTLEAVKNSIKYRQLSVETLTTDYHNGWYRLEIELTIDV